MKLFKDKSAAMSLERTQTVHGVEIKRIPTGRYLKAMEELKAVVNRIVQDLSGDLKSLMEEMKELNEDNMAEFLTKLLIIIPKELLQFFAQVSDIDVEVLLEEKTPMEVFDIVKEFWEFNDLSNFCKAVAPLLKKLFPAIPAATGSSV